jgi:UrcA family protein
MVNFVFGHPRRLFVIGAIAVGLSTLAVESPAFGKDAPVGGHTPTNVITLNVSHADLDLASAADGRSLYRRMDRAVSSYCSDMTGGYDGTNDADNAMRQCHDSAWGQVRPQIERAINRARDLVSTGSRRSVATSGTIAVRK